MRSELTIRIGVPECGVEVVLSFNGYDQTFSLEGGVHDVPAVRLRDGRIMADIGHGVPVGLLEELGCVVSIVSVGASQMPRDNYYFGHC